MIPSVSKRQSVTGQIAVLSSAVLMSTNGLFVKLLPWHPAVISCMRSFIAALFLLTIRLIFPPPKENKNELFPLLAGGASFAATMLTLTIAFKLTTSANAILLQFGSPVWAAILGWYFVKEKPHWEQWGALLLIMGGLGIFFRDSLGGGALIGDALAVISGMFYASQSVFLRMMKNGNPSDAMLLGHVICAAVSMPFLFIYPPSISLTSLLSVTYMGLFQIGLSSLLFSYGIKRIRAVQAMLTTVAEPVLNPIWVLFLAGEKPSMAALAGGAIIIAAVVASSIIGMRREDKIAAVETPS